MKTPNQLFWLVNANYLPEKREMVLEFANSLEKIVERFKFFPSFYVEEIDEEQLKRIAKQKDIKKFQFLREGKGWKTVGATFSDLNWLTDELEKIGLRTLLLEPERQFLLERNWSYFDSFSIEDGEMTKLSNFSLPNTALSFLPTNLNMALEEMKTSGGKVAFDFAKRIATSNLLSIPLDDSRNNSKDKAKILIENFYFKKNIPLQKRIKESDALSSGVKGKFDQVAELNFSKLWSTLLTFPFFNLGIDTINCSCCKPNSLDESNILPNALVKVKFISNGIYFQSNNNFWAQEFHSSKPGKEERTRHKNEWVLNSIPVGPFFENDSELIPLADYKDLSEKRMVMLLEDNQIMKWFCRKKESTLSKIVNGLNQRLIKLNDGMKEKQKGLVRQSNLLAFQEVSSRSRVFYLKSYVLLIEELLNNIPKIISSSESEFFSEDLVEGFECIKNTVLKKFRSFAAKNGTKCIPLSSSRAFIESDSALKLLEDFSEEFDIPRPEIISHRESISLGL